MKNKNAMVCGSSKGIGASTAIELSKLGASITLVARNEESLSDVLEQLDSSMSQKHSYLLADFDNSENKKLSLTVDGQIQKVIGSDSKILLKKSRHYAHLIKFNKYDYFSTLRDKMYWKGNLRIK